MIDTVVLLLDKQDYIISKPHRFNPSAEGLMFKPYYPKSNQGYFKSINNPKKKEIQKHGYLPRLTLIARNNKDKFLLQLRIEFSAPKMLYGNNFDELCNDDIDQLITVLKSKLRIMGIATSYDRLRVARVSAIHYSKNIILDQHVSCSFVLNELRKVDLNKTLDLSSTDYRNSGHVLRYHTNSYEIVFYDKLKDLERSRISEKRSIESDNSIQLDLFNKVERKGRNEILRFEIRLNLRSLKKILNKLSIENSYKFEDLFDLAISKNILYHFLESILESWTPINKPDDLPENMYLEILNKSGLKPNKILHLMGALYIINSIGYRGLRDIMGSYSERTWYRLKSELDKVELKNNFNLMILTDILQKIDKFELTKIEGLY